MEKPNRVAARAAMRARFARRLLDGIQQSYPQLFVKLSVGQSDSPKSVIDALVGAAMNERGEVRLQAIRVLTDNSKTYNTEFDLRENRWFGEVVDCQPIARALLCLVNSSPVEVVTSIADALPIFARYCGFESVQALCGLLDRTDIPTSVKVAAVQAVGSCDVASASAAVPIFGRLLAASQEDEELRIEIAKTLQAIGVESRSAVPAILIAMSDKSASEDLRREAGLALLACEPRDRDLEDGRLSPAAQDTFFDTLHMIGRPATNLRRHLYDLWMKKQPRGVNDESSVKKSTKPGAAQEKIIATLIQWHEPEGDACVNWEWYGVNELARRQSLKKLKSGITQKPGAGVSAGSVSEFFKLHFGREGQDGHSRYKVMCVNNDRALPRKLLEISDQSQRHNNYGTEPPTSRLDGKPRGRRKAADDKG